MKTIMKYFYLFFIFNIALPQDSQIDCSNINIIQNDTIICKGDSLELNVPDGYNYFWSTGEISSNIIVSPSETTGFSVQISSVSLDTININTACNTSEFALGDVNYDQLINVQDIVLIIDWMLEEVYSPCGDVNCDQILDEEDINIIQNFILGIGDIVGCINCVDDILVIVETCGCTDPLACNYCAVCTMDDDSCWYLDDCNDTVLEEPIVITKIYKQFDLFGREYSNMKFQIEVLNDGSVKKKIKCNPFY